MREQMFSNVDFTTAVFIGGMEGIIEEFELLRRLRPKAKLLPIASTGGAVCEIAQRLGSIPSDLCDDLDYVALFHRHLSISVKEKRFRTPADQPAKVADRLWRAKPGKRTS